MRKRLGALLAAMVLWGGADAEAQETPDGQGEAFRPINLSLQPDPESVYAPPAPLRENQGVNEGGVHLDLNISYFTDFIYRGIELFEAPSDEDTANLQIYGKLSFDLGKLPHPFVAVFVNIAESDPISTFQAIWPYLGFDWNLRPFILSAGYTSYIYPDRDNMDTQEIWAQLVLDDSYFLKTDKPLLSPYIYAAYDFDLYNGYYIEAGVSHNFEIENTGLTITAEAEIAYVYHFALFDENPADGNEEQGFQHYQLGLIGNYSLNRLLNIPKRYGEWSIIGYLYYTDGIDHNLRADDQIWGGAGIGFRY